MQGHGWERVTGDARVFEGSGVLFGLVLLVSTTGGDVTLYDGADAGSGRLIGTFEGIANESRPIVFGRNGILLDKGLFVDVGSNVTEVLVVYNALSGS